MEIELISEIRKLCIGQNVYKAKNRIIRLYPSMINKIDIEFIESTKTRFIVTDCLYDERNESILLKVTSSNPIKYLPSIYQDNDFLRNFLMIFQHIMNETSITLDNLDNLFRPMEIQSKFLPLIASWLGVNLDLLENEEISRKLLQNIIPLYKYRGTKIGLQNYLYIVSGIVPEIYEGELPFEALSISAETNIDSTILDINKNSKVFSVYFPVYSYEFSPELIKCLYLTIQNEKPVDTQGFLYFKKEKMKPRKNIVISNTTQILDENGIII